jgi:S-adenosylmethionine:tRNA ribosyltransferase-isomerase
MRLDAFDYQLPASLIAQTPLEERSASRLLVVDRASGRVEHSHFRDLSAYLVSGDVIVVNRSRVIPARLFVHRKTGGRIELFVTRVLDAARFTALANPMRRLRAKETLKGEDGAFECRAVGREGKREVRIELTSGHTVSDVLDSCGHVPLPPYIQRPDEVSDRERYQTIFADETGSVAAPTAGLHFTDALFDDLTSKGIEVYSIVLHVGLGTFLPLDNDTVENNTLHSETYTIHGGTLRYIADAMAEGRRVVAVGTTVTRVLETVSRRGLFTRYDTEAEYSGETDLFIYPGFEFECISGLITNFHLPMSSLLLLVAAFLGPEKTLESYREAVDEKYRFYSYGDAMFIR